MRRSLFAQQPCLPVSDICGHRCVYLLRAAKARPSPIVRAEKAMETNRRPLIAAATLLGIGMGGFVDGILFHQILQFHNMLSAPDTIPRPAFRLKPSS